MNGLAVYLVQEKRNSGNTRGWGTYWQGARDSDAYTSGGVSHPAVATFWDEALAAVLPRYERARILDIATGSGAVIESLSRHADKQNFDITCLDISDAAIDGVRSRFPDVTGIVADARDIPLDSGGFDLVTSQFGIEYAGIRAFDEAARLLDNGGTLLLLVHIRPGLIYEECAAARTAVERTRACHFVPLAIRFFEAGFAAVRGADRTAYDRAGTEFNPAIQEVGAIITEYGEHVAGDTIMRLYSDIQRIHTRIQHYDPNEVLTWLKSMRTELAQYEERMASMCDSAFDKHRVEEASRRLRERGLDVAEARPLQPGGAPLAWIVEATRVEQKEER